MGKKRVLDSNTRLALREVIDNSLLYYIPECGLKRIRNISESLKVAKEFMLQHGVEVPPTLSFIKIIDSLGQIQAKFGIEIFSHKQKAVLSDKENSEFLKSVRASYAKQDSRGRMKSRQRSLLLGQKEAQRRLIYYVRNSGLSRGERRIVHNAIENLGKKIRQPK